MTLLLQREPLRDVIGRKLTEAIVYGELGAGERIPLVSTAERLGVSMTPLRESLVQLERDGLVAGDPGRGYSVAPLTAAELEEIYPLIGALEGLAVELAPPSPSELEALAGLNDRLRDVDNAEEAHELDRAWHARLTSACTNRSLLDFLDNVKRRASRYEIASRHLFYSNLSESVEHHRRILETIGAGDLEGATRSLRANWRITPELLIPTLGGYGTDE